MKKLHLLAALFVMSVLGILGPVQSAFADGATVTRYVTIAGTQTIPFTNPCTGATGQATINYNETFTLVERPVETYSLSWKFDGSFLLVPGDPAQPTSSGHFVQLQTVGGGMNDVRSFVLVARGTTSDGYPFSVTFINDLIESATGITIAFDKCL